MMSAAALDELVTARANILIVDDRPEGLLAMESVLGGSHTLVKAASGFEAVQSVLCHDFAVILLDVQMPEMDGFETARLIRDNPRSRDVPIIFVTAINKETRHINQGYECGAVDYVFKPFDPLILKSKVGIFVELYNKNLQIKRQAALLREIEKREKEHEILSIKRENLRRYANLADAVPHIIVKVHPDGKEEYCNQRWYEYTGFSSGLHWERIVHPQDKRRFMLFWLSMRHRRLPSAEVEVRIKRAEDQSYRWHLVRAVEERAGDAHLGWIATCTDIDDIKRAEEAAHQLSSELNRSNRDLEEFAYIASHDLKEPLHVISSFAHLLEKKLEHKLDNAEGEYLKHIKQSIHQAQALIKDLLEYSRLGREKAVEVVDLSAVLAQVCANLKTSIEETGTVIQSGPLPTVMASRLGMVEVFQNLIGNAIKYRSKEPPRIVIAFHSTEAVHTISIQDNGIGIDPEYKTRIFDMFQRLHTKSEYAGTGIGLAICKKILDNYGSKIWVDSTLGNGATFYFTIKKTPDDHSIR